MNLNIMKNSKEELIKSKFLLSGIVKRIEKSRSDGREMESGRVQLEETHGRRSTVKEDLVGRDESQNEIDNAMSTTTNMPISRTRKKNLKNNRSE